LSASLRNLKKQCCVHWFFLKKYELLQQ
jgi:hypothetical protein